MGCVDASGQQQPISEYNCFPPKNKQKKTYNVVQFCILTLTCALRTTSSHGLGNQAAHFHQIQLHSGTGALRVRSVPWNTAKHIRSIFSAQHSAAPAGR